MTDFTHEKTDAGRFAGRVSVLFAALSDAWDRWQTVRSLRSLDERHLRDIGLIPGDIDAVHGTEKNGATPEGLLSAARRRSGNW